MNQAHRNKLKDRLNRVLLGRDTPVLRVKEISPAAAKEVDGAHADLKAVGKAYEALDVCLEGNNGEPATHLKNLRATVGKESAALGVLLKHCGSIEQAAYRKRESAAAVYASAVESLVTAFRDAFGEGPNPGQLKALTSRTALARGAEVGMLSLNGPSVRARIEQRVRLLNDWQTAEELGD